MEWRSIWLTSFATVHETVFREVLSAISLWLTCGTQDRESLGMVSGHAKKNWQPSWPVTGHQKKHRPSSG